MRYVSSEEARSDLFLSAAVFLIGPLIVELLLELIPLQRIPGVTTTLRIGLPLVYTVLAPYLLIRYREESVRDYFPKGGTRGFAFGLFIALPIVAAGILIALLERNPVQVALPIFLVPVPEGAVLVARLLVTWFGVAALAIYATAKAHDAFRSDPQRLRDGTLEIGRVVAAAAAIITLLLLLAGSRSEIPGVLFPPLGVAGLLLLPIGVAGVVALALSRLRVGNTTSRAILLTPVLLLALPLALSFNPTGFVQRLFAAALFAGIGLGFGVLAESRHTAYGVLGLALALALATPLLIPLA